jgi:hypothetical protein
MNFLLDEHLIFLKKLINAHVEFIIIGGYSVIFHGYRRTTGDMDIWLKPDNTNKEKLLTVLRQMDFDDADIELVENLDFTTHIAFNIGETPARIDFLTYVNMIKFDDAYAHRIENSVEGYLIPFLHLNDLILSKINTGRLKDVADVEALQQIQKEKQQKNI